MDVEMMLTHCPSFGTTFLRHVILISVLSTVWSLPLNGNPRGIENYSAYDPYELKETFGVWNHSLVPSHHLVWPSVQWRLDDDGIAVISRLTLRLDHGSALILLLTPVEDPITGSGRSCHYQSHGDDSNGTVLAAISNCDGQLRGTIITATEVYTLQPLPRTRQKSFQDGTATDHNNPNTFGKHVLIKRDSLSQSGNDDGNRKAFCGLDSSRPVTTWARDAPPIESTGPTARRINTEAGLTVEVAVFVDYEIWKKYWSQHGAAADSRLQDFVSTIFNNIQILYLHPTMTHKMAFKIVRYDVFKTQPDVLAGYRHRDGDAQMYLDAFCMYQYDISGRNWDQSLLITGYDIHRGYGTDKSISGIARLYGACDPYNSCVLVEGHDFTSVYIATHEIGHGFGMRHDEPYCSSTFIMSGSLGPGKVTWSSCSMNDMGKYIYKLDNNGKNCLRATSGYSALSVDMSQLPGQKYDADQQCAMMHGVGYRHVIPKNQYNEGACSMMWCGQDTHGRIITAHPAMEGTKCGDQRYCLRGRCTAWEASPAAPAPAAVPRSSSVDGGWSGWSRVSCSPCNCSPFPGGLGVVQSTRTCTKSSRNCAGDPIRGIVCNTRCPSSGDTVDDYISRYCEWRRVRGKDPELTGKGSQAVRYDTRACKVFCDIRSLATGTKSVRFYGDLLPDGTPCGRGKYCVGGQCLALACSNSALVGDQSSCPNHYEKCPTSFRSSFRLAPTQAVISTSSLESSQSSEWSTWSVCSVTCGRGRSSRTRQCPLNHKCQDGDDATEVETRECIMPACPVGEWTSWSLWSQCSSSCGYGVQSRYRYCHGTNECVGPSEEARRCFYRPCNYSEGDLKADPRWTPWSSWSSCSVTCGEGIQRRNRTCTDHCVTSSLADSTETAPCYLPACAEWGAWGSWSDCYHSSRTQIRLRSCYGAGKCPGQTDSSSLDVQQRQCEDSVSGAV